MKPKKGDLRIVREWSDKDTRYYYHLEEYELAGTYLGPIPEDAKYEWFAKEKGSFDRVWAVKIAKHYNIPLPELAPDEEPDPLEPGVVTPKEAFVDKRLKKYQKYWNTDENKYIIEDDWKPTREELIASIERSYEFEEGN